MRADWKGLGELAGIDHPVELRFGNRDQFEDLLRRQQALQPLNLDIRLLHRATSGHRAACCGAETRVGGLIPEPWGAY